MKRSGECFLPFWLRARMINANTNAYGVVYTYTYPYPHTHTYIYISIIDWYLDMLGDASSNVHMQYLREGVLMTEAEENKLNQTSFIKVNNYLNVSMVSFHAFFDVI